MNRDNLLTEDGALSRESQDLTTVYLLAFEQGKDAGIAQERARCLAIVDGLRGAEGYYQDALDAMRVIILTGWTPPQEAPDGER